MTDNDTTIYLRDKTYYITMNEEVLTNETIQEFLLTSRQKIGSLSDLKLASYNNEADVESIKGIF